MASPSASLPLRICCQCRTVADVCRQQPKQTTGPQSGKTVFVGEKNFLKKALREARGQQDGRDRRWSRFLRSALFTFKCGGKREPQVVKKCLKKECNPLETSRQWSPFISTQTLIAFRAFFSSGFPVCENLPLCHEPRQTLGPGFFSSGPPARRIWYLLKIEKTIFLPVVTSLPQVIPLRQTTHSQQIWSCSSGC